MNEPAQIFSRKVPSITSIPELYNFLSEIKLWPSFRVWSQIIFSRSELRAVLSKGRGQFKINSACQHIHAFNLERFYGRLKQQRTRGTFVILPTTVPYIYMAHTVAERDFWVQGFQRLLTAKYPQLMPLFLSQREMQQALKQIEQAVGNQRSLTVTRISAKERLTTYARRRKAPLRRYRSDLGWTAEDVATAFYKAEERGQWFKSISVDIPCEPHPKPIGLTIAKAGWYAWDKFNPSLAQVLESFLIEVTGSRVELLKNRGLRARKYVHSPPLVIDFQSSVFSEKQAVRRFRQALEKYPHATKALIHANPYLHMNLSDNIDGSSFDIWVLSLNRVLMLPGLEASEAAIGRVVNHIFENFGEGEVANYERQD